MTSPFRKEQLSPAMIQRYGMNHTSVTGRVVTYSLAVLFALVLGFVAYQVTRPQAESTLLTWKVLAPNRVDITFRVHTPNEDALTCTLRAQDQSRADVGYAQAAATPTQGSATVTYSMRTTIPAYTVEILGCGSQAVAAPQFPEGVIPPSQPWKP